MIQYLSPLTQTQNSKPVNTISAHLVTSLPWPSGKIYRAACANRYMTGFPAALLGPDITTLMAITKEQPAARLSQPGIGTRGKKEHVTEFSDNLCWLLSLPKPWFEKYKCQYRVWDQFVISIYFHFGRREKNLRNRRHSSR